MKLNSVEELIYNKVVESLAQKVHNQTTTDLWLRILHEGTTLPLEPRLLAFGQLLHET